MDQNDTHLEDDILGSKDHSLGLDGRLHVGSAEGWSGCELGG